MRMKLTFRTSGQGGEIPINYQYFLASAIYLKIAKSDAEFASGLHKTDDFKFFNFSWLQLPGVRAQRDTLVIPGNSNGHLFISSPRHDVVQNVAQGFLDTPEFHIENCWFTIETAEICRRPKFDSGAVHFRTLSPILLRTKKDIPTPRDAPPKVVQWDIEADREPERFREALEKNLLHKYESYYDSQPDVAARCGDRGRLRVVGMDRIKRKRIKIRTTYNRSYLMNLRIEAQPALLEFLYECGAGEGNSMGFGCLDVVAGGGVPRGRREQGGGRSGGVGGGRVACRYFGRNHRGAETQRLEEGG